MNTQPNNPFIARQARLFEAQTEIENHPPPIKDHTLIECLALPLMRMNPYYFASQGPIYFPNLLPSAVKMQEGAERRDRREFGDFLPRVKRYIKWLETGHWERI